MPGPTIRRWPLLAVGAVTALLSACSDSTGPDVAVRLDIMHAAAGAGSFAVHLDDDVLAASFDAGDVLTQTLRSSGHTIRLEGSATLQAGTPFSSRDGARFLLALADPEDPELRAYAAGVLDGPPGTVSVTILNLVPGDARSYRIGEAGTGAIVGDLGFGGGRAVALTPGARPVSVVSDTPPFDDIAAVGNVDIETGHAFVVIHPDLSGEPAAATAF